MGIKLFCIPHAGGSATMYRKWKPYIDNSSIELIPVELAGRGTRMFEDCYNSFEEAVDDIVCFIKKNVDSLYVVLGHSMGSWLAFEVCCRLKKELGKDPEHIFFSGNIPPHLHDKKVKVSNLSDDEFADEILKKGGTPKELFQDEELKSIFVPILKADYKIIERYSFDKRSVEFNCGISVFNGKQDSFTVNELLEWGKYTNYSFVLEQFEGGHFFIYENYKEVTDKINSILETVY